MPTLPKYAFRRFLLLLVALLSFAALKAHEIRPAYLQVIQVSETRYEVYWKVPRMGDAVPRIQPVFPEGFTLEVLKDPKQTPGAAIYVYSIESEESLRGKELYINGLNKTLIDVLVSITFLDCQKAYLLLQADKESYKLKVSN